MRIHARPHEKREVHRHGDELTHGRRQIDIVPQPLLRPHGIHKRILLLARAEDAAVPTRAARRIARPILAIIRTPRVRNVHPRPVDALVLPGPRPAIIIAQHIITAPVRDARRADDGQDARPDEAQPEDQVDADLRAGVHGRVGLAREEDDDAHEAPQQGDHEGAQRVGHRPPVVQVEAQVRLVHVVRKTRGDPPHASDADQAHEYRDQAQRKFPRPGRVRGAELVALGEDRCGRGDVLREGEGEGVYGLGLGVALGWEGRWERIVGVRGRSRGFWRYLRLRWRLRWRGGRRGSGLLGLSQRRGRRSRRIALGRSGRQRGRRFFGGG